jgi:hypothetical protein
LNGWYPWIAGQKHNIRYSDYPNIRKGGPSIGRVILKPWIACTAFLQVNYSCRNLSGGPERPGKVVDSYIDYINIRRGDLRLNQ